LLSMVSQRLAHIISAATTLAAAKNGASWAREISWTSRSGELSGSTSRTASPADSPPGSRAEIKRLYLSGASYIRPPFHVLAGRYPKRVEGELRPLRFLAGFHPWLLIAIKSRFTGVARSQWRHLVSI